MFDKFHRKSLVFIFALLMAGSFQLPVMAQTQTGGFGDPSNLVGIWKMTLQPGTHLVSFPLLPEGATVDELIGDQLPGGSEWMNSSRIVSTGTSIIRGSFYHAERGEWIGTLHNLDLRKGYWLIIPDDADPVNLRLVGAALEADEVEMGEMRSGVNMIGAPFPTPSSLAASGLVESGYNSASYLAMADRVYTWRAGSLSPAWHTPNQGWIGTPFTFQPTHGYILFVAPGHESFNWTHPRPELYNGMNGGQEVMRIHGLTDTVLKPPDFSRQPWGKGPPPAVDKIKLPAKTKKGTQKSEPGVDGRTGR
jgi:hypothetical protein